MNTLTIQQSKRVATTWPDLFLRKGRKLYPIRPDQFSAVRERFNDGRGMSEIKSELPMGLFNQYGEYIGHISYNGRGWLDQVTGPALEIPRPGCKTCEQLDAEGWA
jgi:hypothetical protein